MEIKTYAPVIIPTLNRFEHFTKCIESLEKCTGAECTDVHIGLDYPPSEKYVEGWRKIDAYLRKKESDNRFKSLTVYRRETNYFFSGKGNAKSIIDDLLKTNDSYIVSEDDNEFSPNFLVYINEGLRKYKKNNEVIAICGCSETNWFYDSKSNIVITKLYSAYGIGMWKEKNILIYKDGTKFLMNKHNWTLRNLYLLYKRNKCLFTKYIVEILGKDYGLFWDDSQNLRFCDTTYSLYMHLTNKVVISPILSKSKTWGNDGSGVNMAKSTDNGCIILDNALDFKYQSSDKLDFDNRNYYLGDKYLKKVLSRKELYLAWLDVLILFVTFKNRKILLAVNKIIFSCIRFIK